MAVCDDLCSEYGYTDIVLREDLRGVIARANSRAVERRNKTNV